MPKHYAKKGKTKYDPIFDNLNEINSKDDIDDNKTTTSVSTPDKQDKRR